MGPLAARLRDAGEHSMVRHEAAESLGAIAAACPGAVAARCEALLKEYLRDPVAVVAESCAAALDINDYWSAFNAGGAEGVQEEGGGGDDAATATNVSYAALKRRQDELIAAGGDR